MSKCTVQKDWRVETFIGKIDEEGHSSIINGVEFN